MLKPITRRQFLRKVGLVGAAGLTMIIDNRTEGAMFGAPIKTGMNYDYPKPFRISETRDAAIAMPDTRRKFMRMIDKIEDYRSTVLAVTDLIIKKYRGRR